MARKIIFFLITFLVVYGIAVFLFNIYLVDQSTYDEKENGYVYIKLVDPEMAPDEDSMWVMNGFHIMEETRLNAPKYAGDDINCSNCHFDGGNTSGGKNNGISLVGVTQKYPAYSERDKRKISLPQRINNCFERSISGKSIPANSHEMQSLLAYFDWISTPVATLEDRSWLGLRPLSVKVGDATNGSHLYTKYCSSCHGTNGAGKKEEEGDSIPPLWGNTAFNDGAGMSNPDTFASFIYLNMPLGQPFLTEQQAMDIAAFVTKQPRPQFKP